MLLGSQQLTVLGQNKRVTESSCFRDHKPEALGERARQAFLQSRRGLSPLCTVGGQPKDGALQLSFVLRSPPPDAGALAGDSMTLSLISLLSQDISGLWLLLKTSTGASGLRLRCLL